jgi:hypothetical protein
LIVSLCTYTVCDKISFLFLVAGNRKTALFSAVIAVFSGVTRSF